MINTLRVLGKEYPIVKAELHVPLIDESRHLFLHVRGGPAGEDDGFALFEVELPLLESLEDLNGARIHVHGDGEAYEDDTLGTDIIGMMDLSYWAADREGYGYWEIRIDFERIEDREYRCSVECRLTTDDDLSFAECETIGSAEFVVQADEEDPFGDTR